MAIESISSQLSCIVIELSSSSVISGSNLTVTSSWLREHACNDPQGSIEREEYIVG